MGPPFPRTEAVPGALPVGQNSPQKPPHGLYAEKLSGTAFTARTFRTAALPHFPEGQDNYPPGPFSILNDGQTFPNTGLSASPPLPASAFQSVAGFDAFNPQTNFRQPFSVYEAAQRVEPALLPRPRLQLRGEREQVHPEVGALHVVRAEPGQLAHPPRHRLVSPLAMTDSLQQPSPAARLAHFYETLTPVSLAELDALYAPGARFKDPFNEVTGTAAIRRIFEHMFATTDAPLREAGIEPRPVSAYVRSEVSRLVPARGAGG